MNPPASRLCCILHLSKLPFQPPPPGNSFIHDGVTLLRNICCNFAVFHASAPSQELVIILPCHSCILCPCQHIVCLAAFCKLSVCRRVPSFQCYQCNHEKEKGNICNTYYVWSSFIHMCTKDGQPDWLTVLLAGSDPLHVRAIVRRPNLKQRRYCATSWERCKQELNDAVLAVLHFGSVRDENFHLLTFS